MKPRLAFEQIYFGESPDKDAVLQALKMLVSGQAVESAALGQQTLLPAQLKLSQPDAIDSVFGKGFYKQIVQLEPGKWSGPVTSVYGTHLVRTLDGQTARMPPLEEVRDSVLKDWQSAKAKEHREQDYAQRRGRYTIRILGGENTEEESR